MRVLITGNMGYVGPVLIRFLREHLDGAELIGFDSGFFAHSLTGASLLPETLLDRQIFGDIREFPPALLDRVDAIPGPVLADASWAGDEPDVVTLEIDACVFEQPFQDEAGQDRRAQAQAFHRTDVSLFIFEIGADCQEPIGVMRKGA